MNDQQTFLQGIFDSIQNAVARVGSITKELKRELETLDELASDAQDNPNIDFEWLFEFREEIRALKNSDAVIFS